jgi:serine/threonine protein kinase
MPQKAQDDDLVISLVDLALACPAGEREAYLRGACARDGQPFDHELFAEAWRYVQWEERMGGFLLDPLYSLGSSEVAFQPGELLDGRFRIVRQVGEGGMGLVYEAQDEKLERRVALKFTKAGFRKGLPPEVRHAREISHPNVCKIFDIHTATTDRGEIDFLSMEFLEGDTLSDRLRAGPLPEREARALARQLASGLAACANQVIHGDLKSTNIILTKAADGSPRAVITDFGLARGSEAALANAASAVDGGTPDYMVPELWRGQKATVASDIYALGVIFGSVANLKPKFANTAVFPLNEEAAFFLLNVRPAFLAALVKAALSSGMRSNWDLRAPCGKAETPNRLIPAWRRAVRTCAASPSLSVA